MNAAARHRWIVEVGRSLVYGAAVLEHARGALRTACSHPCDAGGGDVSSSVYPHEIQRQDDRVRFEYCTFALRLYPTCRQISYVVIVMPCPRPLHHQVA